jgi:hypothetical protein
MGNQVTSAPEPFSSTCLYVVLEVGAKGDVALQWRLSGNLFYFWAYNTMPGVLHILSIPAGFSVLFP